MKARTARRLVAASATVAVLLAAPGLVGTASAHDGGGNDNSSRHGASTLPAELLSAVKTARDAYFAAATKAKDGYRATVMTIRTTMQNETAPQLAAAQAAKKSLDNAIVSGADQATVDGFKSALRTAVEAYRTALSTSKTAHATEFANALTAAQNAITAAGTLYTQAVAAAFTIYAPGVSVPPGLLIPPGQGFGKSMGPSQIEGLHLDGGKGRH